MWNDGAEAATEGRTVWTAGGALIALIALCAALAGREDPAEAVPYLVILAATALVAWFLARVAGRAAHRLRTADARFRAAAEALPDGLLVCDKDDRITYFNSRYPANMTPALRSVLALGKDFESWIVEGAAAGPVYHTEMGADFLERRIALRREERNELVYRIADGRWIRNRENRIPEGGRVLLTTDVTEERERAAQLRLLALAVEQAADPVEITGADHRFTYVNRAFEATTGLSAAEALGREPQELLSSGMHPHTFFTRMRRELEAGRNWHGTIVNRHRDGHLIEQETTISPLKDENGIATHFVAVKRDVTEANAQARALAASEARYRAVVEAQTEFIVRIAPDGRWTFMNEAAERDLGMTLAEMRTRGLRDVDLIHEEDRSQYEAHLAQISPESPTARIEWRGVYPDGRVRWERWTDTGIFDSEGRLIEIQCVGRDITEHRRAEAARDEAERALAEREALFRTIAESAPIGIVISDLESGMPLYINPRSRRTLGIGPEDRMETLLDVWEKPAQREALRRELDGTGASGTIEADLRLADGRRMNALLSAARITYGGREAILAAIVDMTELRRTEAALVASEARLNAINDANPVPMNIARLSDRKLLFVNAPYVRLYGLEGIDLETFDRDALYPDPRERDRLYDELAAGREVTNFEIVLRRPDGSEVPVSLTSRLIVFEGEPAIVTTWVDLTALRAAQGEAARSREALHQSEKLTALGALLAGVAHELNNPLSVVVGYSSMLREMGCEQAMQPRVEKIHAAAERCARIVRTFLAMARARPPRREPVMLGEVVTGALELAAYGLRSADIEVAVDLPEDLPPVHGDADQLHQVVVNLAVNAQQALIGRPAPRRLRLRARAVGGEALLEVADNGPGMAPEVAKRVFEPFFTTKPQGVGTGVGLSVCHGIVAAHGGRMELDTAEGGGARFRVYLPFSTDPAAARAPVAVQRAAGGRVLVVDDEPEIAALLEERLRADGLHVATAASGRLAVGALEAGDIDAVISDLRMPDMDGAALADEIRRRWPGLANRILLMTGDALGGDPGGRLAAQGLPIFEKPLDLAALAAELHRRLARGRAAR